MALTPRPSDGKIEKVSILVARGRRADPQIDTNLKPILDFAKKAYGARQCHPEEWIPDHPIRAYGYEIKSAGQGRQYKDGIRTITLRFAVQPMPYAFADAADRGVNAQACSDIAHDLRFAIFKFSLRHLFFKLEHTAEDARDLLDHLVNHGRTEPTDPSAYVLTLRTALFDRLERKTPAFVCELPFAEGS